MTILHTKYCFHRDLVFIKLPNFFFDEKSQSNLKREQVFIPHNFNFQYSEIFLGTEFCVIVKMVI